MQEIKVGDLVYHKSNSSIAWVVEDIKNNEFYCSTIDKETRKQIKETFSLVSVMKIENHSNKPIIHQQRRKNLY